MLPLRARNVDKMVLASRARVSAFASSCAASTPRLRLPAVLMLSRSKSAWNGA